MTISEENQEWINQRVTENPAMTKEQITGWFNEAIEELKAIGLDVGMGCVEGEPLTPEFMNMVYTATVGKVQANITVKPTEFQLMMLGPYPERRAGKKSIVEMIAIASIDGTTQEISTLTAWENFVSSKNDVEPLGSYQTGVTFFEDDRKEEKNVFRLTVQGATVFSNETKCDFIGKTYDEKLKNLRAAIPSVALGDVDRNLSRGRKDAKSGKTYADSLDLKKITVQVVGTADGVDKNGRGWAMYHVVDGTFKPTVKVKHIPVWVDTSIFERLQAGDGSFLEIYGMLQKRQGDDVANMSACFVHPLAVKPLERKEDQAQIDQPGGNVVTPEAPQIQVMASAGM